MSQVLLPRKDSRALLVPVSREPSFGFRGQGLPTGPPLPAFGRTTLRAEIPRFTPTSPRQTPSPNHEFGKIDRQVSSNCSYIHFPENVIPTNMTSIIKLRFIARFCSDLGETPDSLPPLGRFLNTPLSYSVIDVSGFNSNP